VNRDSKHFEGFDFDDDFDDVIDAADSVDLERQSLANVAEEERIEGLRQDRDERKKYAKWYFWLVAVWIASMVILLFVEQECGRRGATCLSDTVLMTALGTTTASVISILAFVGRYLFKQT